MIRIGVMFVAALILMPSALLAQGKEFSIHGYIDLEFEYSSKTHTTTFDPHHLNVITIFAFDNYRVFSETEYEHGARIAGSEGEGEITVERAWIEWAHSNAVRLRAGKFLTPFGIYNLIHDATPTFLTSSLPYQYNEHDPFGVRKGRVYAKSYSGLQALGTLRVDSPLKFNYALGVGNGRSDNQFHDDNDSNKALIARIEADINDIAHVGLSHYRDRRAEGLSGKERAREELYGVDAEFDNDRIIVQSEYGIFRLEKDDIGKNFQTGYMYYALLAYRFHDLFTPIFRIDHFDPNKSVSGDAHDQLLLGVNVSPHPRVYLKTEMQFRSFHESGKRSVRIFLSSIAVAF